MPIRWRAAYLLPLAALLLLAARLPFLLDPRFLDSDEAVTGLMGLGILRGEFPLYYWASGYPSSLEAFLVAGWLAVVPSARVATKLAPLMIHLATVGILAWMAWKLTRSAAAAVATVLAAALLPWPIAHFGTQALGRSVTPFLGVVMWAVFLFGGGTRQAGWLGFLLGIGYWSEASIMLMAGPPGLLWVRDAGARLLGRPLWLDSRMVSARWIAAFLVAFVVGVAPHLYGKYAHLAGPRPGPNPGSLSDVAARMHRLAVESIPGAFSMDRPPEPGTPGFPLRAGTAAGVIACLLVAFLAVPAARRAAPGGCMDVFILFAAGSLVLFVASWAVMSNVIDYMGRRYLVFTWPGLVALAGLGGWALARIRPAAAGALAGVALACLLLNAGPFHARYGGLVRQPETLVRAMDAEGLKGGFANYWICNLAMLETRGRLIVTQSTGGPLRHPAHYEALAGMNPVAVAFNPAWFVSDGALMRELLAAFRARRIGVRIVRHGDWVLAIFRGKPPTALIDEARARFPSG